jgi:hypothetical protein
MGLTLGVTGAPCGKVTAHLHVRELNTGVNREHLSGARAVRATEWQQRKEGEGLGSCRPSRMCGSGRIAMRELP